jgi:hypothetical protein
LKRGFIENIDFTIDSGVSGVVVVLPDAIFKVSDYEVIIKIHGFFMFFAWGVLPFIAIYIARFMKHLGHKWYLLHMGIMLFAAVLTIIAFFLIVLCKPPPHFSGPHRVMVD